MKITAIRLREYTGTLEHPGVFWEERLIRPIDVYPEHNAEAAAATTGTPVNLGDGRHRLSAAFLEIETDEGVTGLAGPVAGDVAFIIGTQFRSLLIGEDPLAIEKIWDKMYRLSVHGRKGPTMMAISAIDCALWDLKGRWFDAPVYKLLGGPIRETMPAYASMLGYSIEPDKAAERAKEAVAQGYTAMKWFPRGGPVDGKKGIARNVELMRSLREAVGDDIDIMFDAWMSWNVPFTIANAEQLKEFNPRWIEEPVMPDFITGYAEIRRRSPVPTSGGEHEYTRWGIKQLLDAEACDFLQPDTYWAGGISELLKIANIASTYDIPVIPHGHSVPANVHLSAALPTLSVPYVEFLVKWNAVHQFFWKEPLLPIDGYVTVPQKPGMGMEIDEGKVESSRELTWE
ncbi:L-lyxonate dehydratase [soil metagenome]